MYVPMPIVIRELTVLRVTDVTPRMVRITVGGPQLRAFANQGFDLTPFRTQSPDDHVKLVFADQETGVLSLPTQDDGHLDWPESPRSIHRDYTVRRFDAAAGEHGEVDLDFVVHDHGVAGQWATRARPGDVLHVAGPRGSHLPDAEADWWLLVADETGLPAVGRFLEEFADTIPQITAVVIIDGLEEEQADLPGVIWVHRRDQQASDDDLLAAVVRHLPRPTGRGWGWVGAETAIVKTIRRFFTQELGLSKDELNASGYWRRGETIDDTLQAMLLGRSLTDLMTPYAIRAAVMNGIFDAIAEGIDTPEAIADRTSTHLPLLRPLLIHLAEKGVLTSPTAGRYLLTTLGRLLVSGEPRAAWLDLNGAAGHIDRGWAGLPQSLRSGRPGFEHVFDQPFWSVINSDAQLAASFDDYIAGGVSHWAGAVSDHLDRIGGKRILDVGGGNGTLLATLLDADPARTGAVLELEHSARAATNLLAEQGFADRGVGLTGSFLESVPDGFDTYLMAQVIHDWPDDQATTILRHCAAAASIDGRVLLIERLDDHAEHAGMSLMMHNLFGAKERSSEQYAALAEAAGLTLKDVVPLGDHMHLIDLRPADG